MAATAAFPAANRTQAKGTFVIGAEGDPVLLDPSLVSDGTSLRTTFQIFEGLVRNKAGTLKIEPALATSWKASKNGLVWTFPLRKGVKFTDGTPFNSAAVCANFTRWWYRPAQLQGDDISYYWNTVFGGYAKPAPGGNGPDKSLYHGCKTAGPYTVKIILARRSTSFLGALALANFGIASPTALKKYNADAGTVGRRRPVPAERHICHAESNRDGPVQAPVVEDRRQARPRAQRQVLGPEGQDEDCHPQADLGHNCACPGPADGRDRLREQPHAAGCCGREVQLEPQGAVPTSLQRRLRRYEPEDRAAEQAQGTAGDRVRPRPQVGRQRVLRRSGSVGRSVPAAALAGLRQEGRAAVHLQPGQGASSSCRRRVRSCRSRLEFWYPTDRPRGYMPDPPRNFQAFTASLEKSGFKIKAHPGQWRGGYVSGVNGGQAEVFLFGWTGDFGDPANFLNVHFGQFNSQFGFNNAKLFNLLTRADQETDVDRRAALYQQASVAVMKTPADGAVRAHHGRRAVSGRTSAVT